MVVQNNLYLTRKGQSTTDSYRQILQSFKDTSFQKELENLGFEDVSFSLSKKEDQLSLKAVLPAHSSLYARFNPKTYRYSFIRKRSGSYSHLNEDPTTAFVKQLKLEINDSREKKMLQLEKNKARIHPLPPKRMKRKPEAKGTLVNSLYLLLRYLNEKNQWEKPTNILVADTSYMILESGSHTYDFYTIEKKNILIGGALHDVKTIGPYFLGLEEEIEQELNRKIEKDWY